MHFGPLDMEFVFRIQPSFIPFDWAQSRRQRRVHKAKDSSTRRLALAKCIL